MQRWRVRLVLAFALLQLLCGGGGDGGSSPPTAPLDPAWIADARAMAPR